MITMIESLDMTLLSTLGAALLFGFVPMLVWLLFWLSEDREHPEPKRLIILSFIGGMAALLIVLPIELMLSADTDPLNYTAGDIFLFAFTEEAVKFLVAFALVLRSRELDEGIDALIYMICTALGFAAFENFLYVLGPLSNTGFVEAATMTNLRFLGATLLHVVASATIGVTFAFAYYARKNILAAAVFLGLAGAIGLHTLFNFLIINLPDKALFTVFLSVWLLTVVLLLITERIKKIDRIHGSEPLPPLNT